jgi:hypothetical protein
MLRGKINARIAETNFFPSRSKNTISHPLFKTMRVRIKFFPDQWEVQIVQIGKQSREIVESSLGIISRKNTLPIYIMQISAKAFNVVSGKISRFKKIRVWVGCFYQDQENK